MMEVARRERGKRGKERRKNKPILCVSTCACNNNNDVVYKNSNVDSTHQCTLTVAHNVSLSDTWRGVICMVCIYVGTEVLFVLP